MEMQYKSLDRVELSTKSGSEGEMAFEGYLSVFGNVDSYGDVVEKGAFAASIKKAKEKGTGVPILENHGGWHMSSTDVTPLGFFSDLEEDSIGLKVRGVLAPTARGKDLYALLKIAPKGFMGMSIGYRVIKARNATREENAKSGVLQFLEEVELVEGSIVTFPANTEARVDSVKSLDVKSIRSIEKDLKAEGFSSSDAKNAVRIFKKHFGVEEKEPENADFGKDLASVLGDFMSKWDEDQLAQKISEIGNSL